MASDVADLAISSSANCLLEAVFKLILIKCVQLGPRDNFFVVIEKEIDQLFW